MPLVGPDRLVDPTRFFVILVDALGDGHSSSPSNSKLQPRMRFRRFTIADMVEAEHRLVTEKPGIRHLHAVIGISMGGMQTFQWTVARPGFLSKAVPGAGSGLCPLEAGEAIRADRRLRSPRQSLRKRSPVPRGAGVPRRTMTG